MVNVTQKGLFFLTIIFRRHYIKLGNSNRKGMFCP